MQALVKDQLLLLTGALALAVATGCDTFGLGNPANQVVNRAAADLRPYDGRDVGGRIEVSSTGTGLVLAGRFQRLPIGTYRLRLLEPGGCESVVLGAGDPMFAFSHPLEAPQSTTWDVLDHRQQRIHPDKQGRAQVRTPLARGEWSWEEEGILGRPVILEQVTVAGTVTPMACGVLEPLTDV